MERWTNKHKQETEQTNKQTKIPGSGMVEFQSYFKFWCYSSSIQSCHWYLSISSVIESPGGWVVFGFFFLLSFRGSCLISSSLSGMWQFKFDAVLRFWNQLCSPPSILLWSWVLTILDYWGLVSLPCPLSLGQGRWSDSQLPAVSVLWWFADFVNFALSFDFGCCSLAQEISFVDLYLPYFS
jgi:hypothetical protein